MEEDGGQVYWVPDPMPGRLPRIPLPFPGPCFPGEDEPTEPLPGLPGPYIPRNPSPDTWGM